MNIHYHNIVLKKKNIIILNLPLMMVHFIQVIVVNTKNNLIVSSGGEGNPTDNKVVNIKVFANGLEIHSQKI